MYSWRTISALLAAVVLTAAAALALSGWLPTAHVPPAAISGEVEMPTPESEPHVRQQPRILRAQPAEDAGRTDTFSNYREWPPQNPSYPGESIGEPFENDQSRNPRLLDRETPPLRGTWSSSEDPPPGEVPQGQAPTAETPATASDRSLSSMPVTPTRDPIDAIHVTKPNDSLWTISKQRYGDPAFYVALYLHNRAKIAAPDRLESGVVIDTPTAAELRRLYPTATPDP